MRRLVLGNLNYSSWSIRPLMVARKVGLPVEEIIVPLDFPETTARLKEISPTAKVPLLIWDRPDDLGKPRDHRMDCGMGTAGSSLAGRPCRPRRRPRRRQRNACRFPGTAQQMPHGYPGPGAYRRK
jgi:hypothetical protein